jgi:uncharacterized protein involved in type VI secretion and phage assembly
MDNNLEALLDWVRNRYFGKYRGVVTDNADPTNRGRIKVRVPAVMGTLEMWAMPCVPYAGPSVGFFSLPPSGAGVWVEFEAGDPSYPIWAGCFWADNEIPAPADTPNMHIWKTEKLTVRLDDDNDELFLSTTSESKITMKSDVKTESGGAKHTVGSAGVESSKGATKTSVADSSFSVNDSSLVVQG